MTDEAKYILSVAKAIQKDISSLNKPPDEGTLPRSNEVIAFSLVRGTRGYIEKNVHQINGTYEHGWFDSCAVMIRRLTETLIIEAFEKHGISGNIKDNNGNFYHLSDLIPITINEPTWNLGRNAKTALPHLKNIGDLSAHNRRFIAHRADIEKIIPELRVIVQEFIYLAGLK
jgi:hypothetical protein